MLNFVKRAMKCQVKKTQSVGNGDCQFDGLESLEGRELFSVSITTTNSSIPMAPSVAHTDLFGNSATPTDALIELDDFRSSYSGINGSGYSVVVLDSGINLDHVFFGDDLDSNGISDRIVYSWDFADNDSDATDVNNHGSNVSSIIGGDFSGTLGNGTPFSYQGIAPEVNIIHLKVFKDNGAGSFGYTESALQWVINNVNTYNIVSVNMSLGDPNSNYNSASGFLNYGIADELAALAGMDVITVAAAGNNFYSNSSAQGLQYPAADPSAISVGAVYAGNDGGTPYGSGAESFSSDADRISPFSQRSTSILDIFAPGAPILGAGAAGSGSISSQHGTSQAAPHIAGAAVLIQELAEDVLGRRLSLAEFRSVMNSSGATINDGDDENDNVTNTGANYKRLDMLAFANAIMALQPIAPEGVELVDNAAYDTGVNLDDDVTNKNNSNSFEVLQFEVTGTLMGGTVRIYSGTTLIGTAMGTAGTTYVTTDGSAVLGDGVHQIHATQTAAGQAVESDTSGFVAVTVDSVLPTITGVVRDNLDRNEQLNTVTFTFSELMDTTSLSGSGFGLILKSGSGDVDVTADASFAWGTLGGVSTLTFAFSGSLAAGYYRLSISDILKDVAGNVLGDMDTYYEYYKAALGDYNIDGIVNQSDYAVWATSFANGGGTTFTDGDGNGDGAVTQSDYAVWATAMAAGVDLTYTSVAAIVVNGGADATDSLDTIMFEFDDLIDYTTVDMTNLTNLGLGLYNATTGGIASLAGAVVSFNDVGGKTQMTIDLTGLSTALTAGYYRVSFTDTLEYTNGDQVRKIQQFYEEYKAAIGDANLDGTVNDSDLGILLANFGLSGDWSKGDFNNDNIVNDTDLGLYLANNGTNLSYSSVVSSVVNGGADTPNLLDTIMFEFDGLIDYTTIDMTDLTNLGASLHNQTTGAAALLLGATVSFANVGGKTRMTFDLSTLYVPLTAGYYRLSFTDSLVYANTNGQQVSGISSYYEFYKAIGGDADLDGDVDGGDFGIWQAGYGLTTGATWAVGDFDHDGDVDGADYGIWQVGFGQDVTY